MGAGDGNGNGTGPKTNEVAKPCNQSPGHAALDSFGSPLPKRPHVVVPDAPQQVSDPASYAIAGKILLAVAGAFAGVLLALVALHLYYSARRRRLGLGGGQRRLLRSLAIAGGGDEDRRDGDGDGAGALSSPRGLDSAVLAAIPVVVVDVGAGKGGDCAVCLAELEPGEKARALPRCGHRFHVECIDAWFRGNATCPLCRADVVVVAPAAAAPSAPAEGGAQPEVRIDVAADAVAAPANGSTVAPVMGRLHSGRDLEKARRVFASTRFSSF
ncbi:E3 ubiquitin-protein ligase ATL41-like [Miscanthus floridulus]|uniref:E3 ubiquitin-protein ligase ATL41-like n=1 Tax=Miscanthus floridulus TaxID=154761 RepID=UPI003457B4EE